LVSLERYPRWEIREIIFSKKIEFLKLENSGIRWISGAANQELLAGNQRRVLDSIINRCIDKVRYKRGYRFVVLERL
jgi:hypothetical protein